MIVDSPAARSQRLLTVLSHPVGADALMSLLASRTHLLRVVAPRWLGRMRLTTLARLSCGRVSQAALRSISDDMARFDQALCDTPTVKHPPGAFSGVGYALYVPSYQDSDGDGVGDLKGVLSRLGHLDWLGVQAIALYGIVDGVTGALRADVGTASDLTKLIDEAHRYGMTLTVALEPTRVTIDHPDVLALGPRDDRAAAESFVVRDASSATSLTNWTTLNGTSAWRPLEGQRALLTLTDPTKAERNLHDEATRRAIQETIFAWAETGVDALWLECANRFPHTFHDGCDERAVGGVVGLEQTSLDPVVIAWLTHMSAVCAGRYGVALGVTTSGLGPKTAAAWADHLSGPVLRRDALSAPERARSALPLKAMATVDTTAPLSRAFGSFSRSRWLSGTTSPALRLRLATLINGLLLSSSATPWLTQGEELGRPNVAVAGSQAGVSSRMPMPWSDLPYGGFSTTTPWLWPETTDEVDPVDVQINDPASVLTFTRDMIELRQSEDALRRGEVRRVQPWRRDVYTAYRKGTATLYIEANLSPRMRPRKHLVPGRIVASNWLEPYYALRPYEFTVYKLNT